MASPKLFSPSAVRYLRWSAYVLTVGIFLWICSHFYIPGKGFTYLIRFGAEHSDHYLPALRATGHFEEEASDGYDGQHYAQLAMQPRLDDHALQQAVDNLPYRGRRILFEWTAYALAGGDPVPALHLFATQNIFCWLLLAALLLRWFPATSWANYFRWFGILFSSGLCLSVRGSLLDGPSLLLIAGGVALAESGRSWWSALVLGISGLGKETNILAAVALPLPSWKDGGKKWAAWIGRGLLVLLPIVWWMVCLRLWLGPGNDVGERNFAGPFVGYFGKWVETYSQLETEGFGSVALWNLLILISLTTQFLFFVLRPRWSEPWWRIGMVYAVLMLAIGDAVWEFYPGASTRVLLPMLLAFNILVPRNGNRWWWWTVLLLGNLTIFFSTDFLKPPGRGGFALEGPTALTTVAGTTETVEVRFGNKQWYPPEFSRYQLVEALSGGRLLDYWRWSYGDGTITFHNPQPFAVIADVNFDVKSNDERVVTVRNGESVIWSGKISRALRHAAIRAVLLPPGDTTWRFEADQPATYLNSGGPRKFGVSLRNLELVVTGRGPEKAAVPTPSP